MTCECCKPKDYKITHDGNSYTIYKRRVEFGLLSRKEHVCWHYIAMFCTEEEANAAIERMRNFPKYY